MQDKLTSGCDRSIVLLETQLDCNTEKHGEKRTFKNERLFTQMKKR